MSNSCEDRARPAVSVIVPVYNAQATLAACVDSLLQLEYPRERLQLLFVDNASRDSTAEILLSYGPRIEVLRETKRGAAAARNRGLRAASGEIAAFIDADCRADPGWLSDLIAPLEDARVGISGGKILAEPGANYIAKFGERIHDHRAAIEVYKPAYAISMNWASRRELLLELGLFDERLRRGQDVDLAYRISQAGYSLAFRPAAIVYHRNEERLRGLFDEGFVHGFHGIKVLKKHSAFVAGFGHRRVHWKSYRALWRDWRAWRAGRDADTARCSFCFNLGKKLGKLCGSIRFLRLDL